MRKSTAIKPSFCYVVCFVLLAGLGPVNAKDVKIPITTSSEKAREYFIEGRDLVERLLAPASREIFEKAIAEDSNFASAYLELAYAQPSSKEFFVIFDKALALMDNASKGEQLKILAVQAGHNGDPMLQRKYFKKLVAAYPEDERAHTLLGTNYFGLQDFTGAIDHYSAAVKINPSYSPPYNQLGYAHRYLGNYEEAEKAFQKYIELIPNDPNPYDSYAELLMKVGKFEESIEFYRKALEIEPYFTPSHIGIATNLNYLGQHEKAREQLQKLYDMAMDIGQQREALYAQAVSHVDEGRLDLALESLQKQYAIAEKNNDPLSMAHDLKMIAYILLELGRYDQALAGFEKSVKLIENSDLSAEIKDNTRRSHLYSAARHAVKIADFTTARAKSDEYRKRAEEKNNPNLIRSSYELSGIIALAEGDYDQALADLKYANQRSSYNLYRIAQAYAGKGDTDQARIMCEKAVNFNALNDMSYAFIRSKARHMLASL